MSGKRPVPAQNGTRSQPDQGRPDQGLQKTTQGHISTHVYLDVPPDDPQSTAVEQLLLGLRPDLAAQFIVNETVAENRVDNAAAAAAAAAELHPGALPATLLPGELFPKTVNMPEPEYRARHPLSVLSLSKRFQHYYALLWQFLCASALQEYERGTVFLLMAICAGSGAVFYFGLEQEPAWGSLGFAAVILAALWGLLRKSLLPQLLCCLLLASVLGMISAKLETWRHSTPMLGSEVSTILTVRIVSLEEGAENKGKPGFWRVVGDVLDTDKPKLRHAPQRLRLSSRDIPAQAEIGTILRGAASLRPHGGSVRPGQYDFAFHGFFRDIGGNGFFLGTPKHLTADSYAFETQAGDMQSGWQKMFSGWIAQMRASIGGRIMQALPGEKGAVAAALISGQRAGISERTNEALRMAGLAHILSISGLHLALAAGVVMVSVRFLAGLFPSLVLYYPVKKFAALISLFSSAFYLAVSGGDVAALRSFIMLTVMLCAVMLDRQALTLRNLAIAALFSIALTPHEILGPSFQMSYSATGALIAAFSWSKAHRKKKLKNKREMVSNGLAQRVWRSLVTTAATSLVAGTASGLYAAYHFNNMAPLGMLGNALALPVISILVMPFAVMSLLVMPLGLEWLPLQVMGAGVELVKYVAHFVAGLSPDLIPGLLPVPVLLLWTGALLCAMLMVSHLRWLAFGLIIAGYGLLVQTQVPDIVISEDGKLVAVMRGNVIYTNRIRPAQFTISNWLKAYSARNLIGPKKYASDQDGAGFVCEGKLCLYNLVDSKPDSRADNRTIAYAGDADAGINACNIADIVILDFSGPTAHCAQTENANQLVITKQMLALKGTAEIYLSELPEKAAQHTTDTQAQQSMVRITHALGAPQRPWHLYRLYSRPARNKEKRYK